MNKEYAGGIALHLDNGVYAQESVGLTQAV